MSAPESVADILPRVLEETLTPDQMVRAAAFLSGMATQVEAQGKTTLVLPTRTARRLADALLAAVNRG